MKKKLMVVLLCICMLLSVVGEYYIPALASENPPVSSEKSNPAAPAITYEGKEIQELLVPMDEKRTIEAVCPEKGKLIYQWQILADIQSEIWIDIYGKEESSLEVSKAMLTNMLDSSKSAYIRCKVTNKNGKEGEQARYCGPICVTISNATTYTGEAPDALVVSQEALNQQQKEAEQTKVLAMYAGAARATEYVSIQINYKDAVSKEPIYSSYTSRIESGTDFNQIVNSPTFLGFQPYYNPNDLGTLDADTANMPAISIPFALTNVTSNVVVNVYYKPVNVKYVARYYFQNIHDDLYTEDVSKYHVGEALTGTIISDDTLAQFAGDTSGFTELYHYPESVAADGSTVFECYYDRNYYLIKFELDGGFGVEPIYARYGTPFIVNKPSRPGYVFLGWDEVTDANPNGDGIADTLPGNIPAEAKSYRALWEAGTTKVTYAYWRESPNQDGSGEYGWDYWISRTEEGVKPGTILSAKDDVSLCFSNGEIPDSDYFEYDNTVEYTSKNVEVKADGTTIINAFYRRKTYTLRFYFAMSDGKKGYYCTTQKGVYTADFAKSNSVNLDSVWESFVKDAEKDITSTPGQTYYYFDIVAKYEENIANLWPSYGPFPGNPESPPRTDNLGEYGYVSWVVEPGTKYIENNSTNTNTISGTYETMSKELIKYVDPKVGPAQNLVMYFDKGRDKNSLTYQLFFQEKDGVTYPDVPQITYQVYKDGGNGNQAAYKFNGFTMLDKTQQGNVITFRYARDYYKLAIHNNGDVIAEDIKRYFEEPLNMQTIVGDISQRYPDNLEAGAYEFAGFYKSPGCIPGTEVDDSTSMPASDIMVYAKWVPVKHKVNFFQTYDDMLAYEANPEENLLLFGGTKEVTHGNILSSITNPPPREVDGVTYTFNGWFYMNNGVKTAYTPLDIPVVKDMDVFAEWSTNVVQPYLIHYVLQGSNIKVADDTTGYAYQGSTRTFLPKTGSPNNQLYEQYNKGYYPMVASHSITMEHVQDKSNPVENEFTFEYVKRENLEYTVRYVDKVTGKVLAPEKHVTTQDAIVTERFRPIENYIPDAFYKRLVLSIDESENVITFYYTENTTTAFYAVHYMMQKPNTNGGNYAIDGSGDYIEGTTHSEGVATINETISITPTEFSGYRLYETGIVPGEGSNTNVTLTDGKFNIQIQAEGTELYIFYQLKMYSYTVKYLNYNDQTALADEKKGEGYYGEVVTENAPKIDGFTVVSEEQQSMTIRANDNGDRDQNIIIFYYIPIEYTVQYKVWEQGGGTLSKEMETGNGDAKFEGSIPEAEEGYLFDGWYLDEACTVPVVSDTPENDMASVNSDTKQLIPNIEKIKPTPAKNIFYAKFTAQNSEGLTIVRNSASDAANGAQTFIYKVTNQENGNIIYVSITGSGRRTIIDLPQGNYKVEQINQWSWRYKDEEQTITLGEKGVTVTFGEASNNQKWLSGNSRVEKNKKGVKR